MQEALYFFKGDEMATKVYLEKYAAKDAKGKILEPNPNQMLERITNEVARIERKYPNPIPHSVIADLIGNFKYIIFGGSGMAAIGLNKPVSLSNCFVIGGPDDSIESICDYWKDQAQLMKRRKNLHCVAA